LEFTFGVEGDVNHRGFIGLPDGSVESRVSDQFLWDTDRLAVAFKARMGGGFTWTRAVTTPAGVTVGPASVLAQR
jgi:hypothetical protein